MDGLRTQSVRDNTVAVMLPHAVNTHKIRDTGGLHRPFAQRHNISNTCHSHRPFAHRHNAETMWLW